MLAKNPIYIVVAAWVDPYNFETVHSSEKCYLWAQKLLLNGIDIRGCVATENLPIIPF